MMQSNDSEAVIHNRTRCQHNRFDHGSHQTKPPCTAKALPGSMLCALHKAEALARLTTPVVRKVTPLRKQGWL